MPDLILDACVLSNFALSRSLEILRRLYPNRVRITNFVYAEILRGVQKGHHRLLDVKAGLKAGWLAETAIQTEEEKDAFERLAESLGLGEASSIAIAACRRLVFASDDLIARREAEKMGVPLTGTLGILKRAAAKKIVNVGKADKILREMIDEGFFAPVTSLKEIKT
jgi:hypothetical protein